MVLYFYPCKGALGSWYRIYAQRTLGFHSRTVMKSSCRAGIQTPAFPALSAAIHLPLHAAEAGSPWVILSPHSKTDISKTSQSSFSLVLSNSNNLGTCQLSKCPWCCCDPWGLLHTACRRRWSTGSWTQNIPKEEQTPLSGNDLSGAMESYKDVHDTGGFQHPTSSVHLQSSYNCQQHF